MADKDIIDMATAALRGYLQRFFDGLPTDYPLNLMLVTRKGNKMLTIKLEDA